MITRERYYSDLNAVARADEATRCLSVIPEPQSPRIERGGFRAKSSQSSARRIRRSKRASFLWVNSCCQIRRTRRPRARRVRFTSRSRILFPASFLFQNSPFVVGCEACFGQPCQKQPSTKTASLIPGNTKSGLPNTGWFRRHPLILFRRKNFISAISVALLPFPRIRDISSERFDLLKTSLMG